MKNITFIIWIFISVSKICLSQSNIILTFSSELDGAHSSLDSIKINNMTQGGDTMLYGTDTTLLLSSTLVSIIERANDLFYIKNNPNPFSNYTTLSINLPNNEKVIIRIYDILGHNLVQYENSFKAGVHLFKFEPSKESVYFLSVEANQKRKVLKMIATGNTYKDKPQISYEGTQNSNFTLKSINSNFLWSSGDNLEFIGYISIGNIVISDTLISAPSQNSTYLFEYITSQVVQCSSSFYDVRDGNFYQTIQIGNQCWMKNNLKYLPAVTTSNYGNNNVAYFYVNGYQGNNVSVAKSTTNYSTFGVLYNWTAAIWGSSSSNNNPSGVQGICPIGWHLPSDAEWQQLEMYLGMSQIEANNTGYRGTNEGGKLKSTGIIYWNSPNTGATNTSNFTAYAGGDRNNVGNFNNLGISGSWWSATESGTSGWSRYLYYDASTIARYPVYKEYGFSVRCVKDDNSVFLPNITTNAVSNITGSSAYCGGNVLSDGNSPITIKGLCWNTSTNPTISNYTTNNGTGTGSFSCMITGLQQGATYYLRAYATNSVGTAYGNQVSFTTPLLPSVTTNAISSIINISAIGGGNVTDDAGALVSARGICWSTTNNPTLTNSYTTNGSGIGTFVSSLTNLTPGTTYYVRAYATNSNGTAYGNEVNFTTLVMGLPCPGLQIITDSRDNNTYNTVQIGNQCWMSENLKYLPSVTYPTNGSRTLPYYYVYDYQGTVVSDAKSTSKYATYGVLYNWTAAMANSSSSSNNPSGVQGVCPSGWHLPSDLEWTQLINYFVGFSPGNMLKESGTTHWQSPNNLLGATNASGFTALPGGTRNVDGTFGYVGQIGNFWSTTQSSSSFAYRKGMTYNTIDVNSSNQDKELGFSVRCIKD